MNPKLVTNQLLRIQMIKSITPVNTDTPSKSISLKHSTDNNPILLAVKVGKCSFNYVN